jgi:hypothetical protein
MKLVNVSLRVIVALTALGPLYSIAAELKPESLKSWEEHVQRADARMEVRLRDGHAFLWAGEAPDRLQRVRTGEILVSPVIEDGVRSVPNALIHDWLGAAFIPNATLESVLNVVHDYDRYKDYYKPVVVDSKLLARSPDEQRFSMLWVRRVLFVTAALDSHYRAREFQLGPTRCYGIAETTQVQQITAYGSASERRLPPDQGDGFIWRIHSIARYQERDGGVYVELEAMVLSRDVPASLRWLLKPIITRLSRNSLVTSLRQTCEAVALSGPVHGNLASGMLDTLHLPAEPPKLGLHEVLCCKQYREVATSFTSRRGEVALRPCKHKCWPSKLRKLRQGRDDLRIKAAIASAQAIPERSSSATQALPPVASAISFNRREVSRAEYPRSRTASSSRTHTIPLLNHCPRRWGPLAWSRFDAKWIVCTAISERRANSSKRLVGTEVG